MLTKGESIDDFIEVTAKEKENLEKSDAEWTEPPRSFIDQWNDICKGYGKYNEATGFFELNDYTDISYNDAVGMYKFLILAKNDRLMYNSCFSKYLYKTILIDVDANIDGKTPPNFFFNNSIIEHIRFKGRPGSNNLSNAFLNCNSLKKIDATSSTNFDIGETSNTNGAFRNCKSLEHIMLSRLRVSISFADSPKLSYDSFRYMVDNRITGSLQQPLTITVHPDVYAKLTDPENEEWYKLNQDALEQQITFATI